MATVMRIFRTSETSPAEINRLLLPPAEALAKAEAVVNEIVARVRAEGDAAVLEYTRRFDWADATLEALRVTPEEMEAAVEALDPKVVHAMSAAAEHIRRYHERQMPRSWFEEMAPGLTLGQRFIAIDSVACYVPTRKASIPSSLLMSVIPAQVAGVPRIVVIGPCRADGAMPRGVLAAAHLLGITEMYKLGGAVAMAALAFGTATFPKVDKVVGPANIYGTLAKKALYGDVGVDGLYGPSEVVIIGDGSVRADWVAIDLVSQSEHGEDSQSVLITPNEDYARAVAAEVAKALAASPRAEYLSTALNERGAIIIVGGMDEAAAVANLLAPEHLELAVARPNELLSGIRHAGAILLGGHSPVPVGDYYAGPSHILPTGRTARFSSGLGVTDFLTRSSLVGIAPMWLENVADDIIALADHEGLAGHAEAVRRRVEG
jgi:histidinol dehydrogenase